MKFNTGRFLKNAAIMTVTSLLLRLAGMFFRVYLANRIGSEGMGLYQLIFSVYMLAATFASTGICTAVTRLTADALESGSGCAVKRILLRSVAVTTAAAAVSTAAVYFCSDIIAIYWIKDARAAISLKILSFSLPFMGVSSCIRGYFIANRRVLTPSNAQLFEQCVRMAVIIAIIGASCERGLEYSCAAVLIGDTVAEAASCGFMYIGYLLHKRRLGDRFGRGCDMRGVTAKLMKIAVPITAGRYLTTALRTVESLLVPDRLSIFNGRRELSVAQYGDLKGMAMPVLFFPASFLTALSTLLVPEFSGAFAAGDKEQIKRSVNRCVGVTLSASMIIAALFMVFGDDIGAAFYGEGDVGFYLRVLAPLVPLMYLESVVTGCLNGLNQQVRSLAYNVADSVTRIALIWFLLPRMGMQGFILVMMISNVLTSVLCLHRLLKVSEVKFRYGEWVIKPAVLAALSAGAAYLVSLGLTGMDYIPRAVTEAAVGGAVYALLTLASSGDYRYIMKTQLKSCRSSKRSA